jgi:hypothetical protein
MPSQFNLRNGAFALVVAVSIAAAISACHSSDVTRTTQASTKKFAETSFGPNGLVDAELTPPFDDRPITPMETVGAPAEKN